jgi:prephenate dehydratase
MPIAAPRWSASSRCRPRRWKARALEQLRALEAGMRIDVEIVDSVPLGVDTPDDLERARAMLGAEQGYRHAPMTKTNRISFQGEPGANSDTACRDMFPDMEPLPCPTFEDAFNAVETGKADLAMIPIENTIAGRVADIHHLLPESRLHIVGEYFLPIHFQLMVLPGVKRRDQDGAQPHPRARPVPQIHPQERLEAVVAGDTAGAAALGPSAATDDGRARAAARRRALRPRHLEENVEDTDTTSPASSC